MPASAARLARMPTHTTVGVSHAFGAFTTSARIVTPIRPLASATPIPSIATSTVPSGANPVKLRTVSVRMRRMPSVESRFTAASVLPSDGCTACHPNRAPSHEASRVSTAMTAKMVIGSGSRSPARGDLDEG